MVYTVEFPLGDETVTIQTGKVAKQAAGSVWVQQGGTVVLVATVAADKAREDLDFFPLTVDYRERFYSIGKIPPVYGRREPRPGIEETLTARLIDHCIRPLFPKEFRAETQVQAMTLSCDQEHGPETLALIGASAALSISDIPFKGPVGGLAVARINGELVAGPTYSQLDDADLEFFVTGTKTAVMSCEGSAHEAPEDDVIAAIQFAHEQIQRIIAAQEELVAHAGKPKRAIVTKDEPSALAERIRQLATQRIRDSIGIHDAQAREQYLQEVRANVVAELGDEFLEEVEAYEDAASTVFTAIEKEEMRRSILENGKRLDGREIDELREITSEVGILPRAHGSALFTRGQTQALCAVTLGTALDEVVVRNVRGEDSRAFFLHYNFPGYSVGEVRRIAAPGRREIGHGALAEKAIQPVIPSREEFPYTVRVVSEILESNASSSMATVCGASLALMDAGVPIKKSVAGVGVGLVKEDDREIILTDMLGDEDHLGDMDFKVAGTADGVTAIQLDIKIDGITVDLMRRAIHRARDARLRVLELMNDVIAKPREEMSPYAPRIRTIKIDHERIGELIGPGGKVIRGLQDEFGVTINVEEDGTVQIASTNAESAQNAIDAIQEIFATAEVGEVYTGPVTRVTPFGAFVEVMKGLDGLIHISDLSEGYVRHVEDVVKVGDRVEVRVTNIDDRGRVDLVPVKKFASTDNASDGADAEVVEGGSESRPGSRGRRGGRSGGRDRGRRSGGSGGGGGRSSGGSRGRSGSEGRGRGDTPRVPKSRY